MRRASDTGRQSRILLLIAALMIAMVMVMVPAAKAEAAGLKLNRKNVTLYLSGKKTYRLKARMDGVRVHPTYRSSAKKIATVSDSGKIRAKKAGSCTITANYNGVKARVRVNVRKDNSGRRKAAIQAYNDFLKQPYVTYTEAGARGQADLFYSLDLDGNRVPELLTAVASGPDRWYVLYNFRGGKISYGQRIGAATVFKWYPKAGVLAFRTFDRGRSYYHYATYDGRELEVVARVTEYNGRTTYRVDGEKVDALEFRESVDHDLLNYEGGIDIIPHVNTPDNRAAFLN